MKKIEKFPKHIAFIMDGNRRWAVKNGLNKMLGHRQGALVMIDIIKCLTEYPEIKMASFFAFSTENWNRSKEEIDYIFQAASDILDQNKDDFEKQNVKLNVVGSLAKLPENLQKAATEAMEKTKNNTGLVVNVCLDYGGRSDIVQAAVKLAKQNLPITEESFQNALLCPTDVDLLVRTSGEMRISNFLLFQLAYAELFFTKKYWPDFNKKQLDKILLQYGKRNRRFGGN